MCSTVPISGGAVIRAVYSGATCPLLLERGGDTLLAEAKK